MNKVLGAYTTFIVKQSFFGVEITGGWQSYVGMKAGERPEATQTDGWRQQESILYCTRLAHCASCCFAEGFPHFHLIPFNKGSDTDLSIMKTFSNKYWSIC